MLNRLPDRGQDTARSVGSFQDMQAALGRATGYSGNFSDEYGARINYNPQDLGGTAFAPGAGNIDTGDLQRGTMGIRRANFSFAAREGDMYN